MRLQNEEQYMQWNLSYELVKMPAEDWCFWS